MDDENYPWHWIKESISSLLLSSTVAIATVIPLSAAELIDMNACFPTGTDSSLTSRKQECTRKLEQYKEVRQKAADEKNLALRALEEHKRANDKSFGKFEKEHNKQIERLSNQIEYCTAAEAHLKKALEELNKSIAEPSSKTAGSDASMAAAPETDLVFPDKQPAIQKEPSGRSVIKNSAELADALFADKSMILPLVRITNPKTDWVEIWTPRNVSLNLKGRYNDPVRSAATGVVVFSGEYGLYGKVVIIQHHRHHLTLYGHLDKTLVERGQTVARGQIIGHLGHTGYSIGDCLVFRIQDSR
ncbi:MAG: peptidoglycan DD-metalloendopeptidase family protein [Candidatus Obscuribacterales bacterium]|nr:peptidoglycan DD-metalloendopeptidase family protein [Candidatus Obscuribacterales bacterium]